MRVIIDCSVDTDPKDHKMSVTDDSFDALGWIELHVEGQVVTVWGPDLSRALMPFVAKYEQERPE